MIRALAAADVATSSPVAQLESISLQEKDPLLGSGPQYFLT